MRWQIWQAIRCNLNEAGRHGIEGGCVEFAWSRTRVFLFSPPAMSCPVDLGLPSGASFEMVSRADQNEDAVSELKIESRAD